MAGHLNDDIAAVIARAPVWLRQDLTSGDAATRARAEDTLAAMIAEALRRDADQPS